MKQIISILAASVVLISVFFACTSKNNRDKDQQEQSSNKLPIETSDFDGGFTSAGRLFPEKLRDIPVGITVAHFPNPTYAVLEDSMYIWKHNTSVQASEDLQLVEYGSFVYTKKGWYLRVTMTAEEFATTYNCKNGLLKKGIIYRDNESWRREKKLTSGDAMWYYIAKDKFGKLVKGTGPIETEGKLKSTTRHIATVSSSSLTWTGYGEIGDYSLSGTVPVKNIEIAIDSSILSNVDITINLAGLTSENDQLATHLKDKDFFDVTKYPTARFISEKINYNNLGEATITGNLTVKGKTEKISFPLAIKNQGSGQLLSGKISIDRTVFGIKYNSKSFFSNLGDQAIKNNFDLKFQFLIN